MIDWVFGCILLTLPIASHADPEFTAYLSEAPVAENTDYGIIQVTVTFGKDNPILGNGAPKYYILQYREEETEWKAFVTKEISSPSFSERFTVSGLKSGVVYEVRTLLADAGLHSFTGADVPVYLLPTMWMCYLPEVYDYGVTYDDSIPGTLNFTWHNWVRGDDRWCPLLSFKVSWTADDGDHWQWQTDYTVQHSYQLTGLPLGGKVQFNVNAITTGGYSPVSKHIVYPRLPQVVNV